MLKVTADAFHEKLDAGEDEIILNGPPADLRGHIFLSNTNEDLLSVKTLMLVHDAKQKNILGDGSSLRISARLRPGEQKLEAIGHELPPQTAPGIYESKLIVGGKERKVKMIVQPNVQVNIHPSSFTFQETDPGKMHTAVFTLNNAGNLPFQVPDVKHVAALDMDLLCRAFGFGFRSKAAEGYMPVLDEIVKNINSNIADWASARVEEYGAIVLPGASILVHLHITLPKNADARKDYAGSVRFWDKEIVYVVKSHNEQNKL
jgi:hypothetical protein